MVVYKPLEDFITDDADLSSRRIRDMPYGMKRFALRIEPASLVFPTTKKDYNSGAQIVVLYNIGYDSLTINGTTVTGDFRLPTPLDPYPTEILPGESYSIQVTYCPQTSAPEPHTGGLYIQVPETAEGEEFVPLSGSSDFNPAGSFTTDFIIATNQGTGTPNYIQAITEYPVPFANGDVLIGVNLLADNTTKTVQIVFNKDAPLAVKNNLGEDFDIGDLAKDSMIIGYKLDNTFRVFFDKETASMYGLLMAQYEAISNMMITKTFIGEAAPPANSPGRFWWESDTGTLYICYQDGDSVQWVEIIGPEMIAATNVAAAQAKASADEAKAARDIAAGYASDAVSQGNVPLYATVVGMSALSVPIGINCIRVNGYNFAGDGGTAIYKKVGDAPSHAGKFQSADGAWWEIAEEEINPLMTGGSMGDALAVAAALGACVRVTSEIAIPVEGCVWPAGVKITGHGKLKRVAGTVTGPMLFGTTAGDYRIDGIEIEDYGSPGQFGMVQIFHANAKVYVRSIKAHGGYSGLWVQRAALVSDIGSEYWDTSHNIYLGTNDLDPHTLTSVDLASFTDISTHDARSAGDGLKTVSGVKKLIVNGGRYYNNAADAIDCYAGCDEAIISNAELSGNAVCGVDFKIGTMASGDPVSWGYRRRVQVTNCLIQNNTLHAVKVDGSESDGILEDVLIANNQIFGNANHAILVTAAIGIQIIGNRFLANGSSGGRSCIHVISSGALTSKDVIVSNNIIGDNGTVSDTTTGITFSGVTNGLVTGNIFGNQNRVGLTQRLTHGLSIGGTSTNIIVDGNVFGSLITIKMSATAGTTILGDNIGITAWVRGQATILTGTANIVFPHLLPGRPASNQVLLKINGKTAGLTNVASGATTTTTATAAGYDSAGPANPTVPCLIDFFADLRGVINTYAITVV